MRPRTKTRRVGGRRVAVVVALSTLALSAALASSAGASHLDPGMSISTAGPAQLVNHVYLAVPVSVTCPVISLGPDDFIQGETIGLVVQQKVGGSTITGG